MPRPGQGSLDDGAEYLAPRTPVEEVIAGIWATVLKRVQVSIETSFFDLGGHSLLATQLVSRVHEAFQVELPLRTLFEQPTVAGLAAEVENAMRMGHGVQASLIKPRISS